MMASDSYFSTPKYEQVILTVFINQEALSIQDFQSFT